MGVSYTGTLVRSGSDRATLVRRTYALVLASVVVTVLGVGFGGTQPALLEAVAAHPIITMLAMFAPLILAMRVRHSFPRNIAFVFLFAFIEGVWIAPWMLYLAARNPGILGQAAFLTLSSFGVLTAYAWLSRRDFSAWGSFFIVGLWVLIATSVLNLFFQSALAGLWISGATVLVFSGLLVFDTWRIRNVYGPDEYVAAAVQIYLDLLNMFLAILNLLGGGRRR